MVLGRMAVFISPDLSETVGLHGIMLDFCKFIFCIVPISDPNRFQITSIWLLLHQFGAEYVISRILAASNAIGQCNPSNGEFWTSNIILHTIFIVLFSVFNCCW
jgi:hypothetical protein